MLALVDRWLQETGSTTTRFRTSVFAGFRFPPEVISLAAMLKSSVGASPADATLSGGAAFATALGLGLVILSALRHKN
jgi:hypothetical protein